MLDDPLALAGVAAVGLLAGTLGGMLGVGGSTIMIPGMTFLLGFNQHVYQAAAMLANVVVSLPATLRHRRAGAIVSVVVKRMLPAALLFIILGVAVSNLPLFRGTDNGKWLGRIMAVFMLYEATVHVRRLLGPPVADEAIDHARYSLTRCGTVGGVMGFVGGLLGIGGGLLAVPLQHALLKLPLRNCIANSAAVMIFSASLGAVFKHATLSQHGRPPSEALTLALLLSPTCWIGGQLGATLTHRLPLPAVRCVFVFFLAAAAWRMLAINP